MTPTCTFPACPSGEWTKDIKRDLEKIQEKQDQHYETITQIGTILARMEAIQRTQDKADKDIGGLFTRVRVLEEKKAGKQDIVWGIGAIVAVVTVIEIVVRMAGR